MKGKLLLGVLFVLLVALLGDAIAEAQGPKFSGTRATSTLAGTAFTYQGQLKNNGTAVNGTCDFEFSLWDGPNLGANQIGGDQPKTNVTVTNGLFTIPDLDFGSGAFNGDARYLLIGVRCPAGSGTFTMLTPRQMLTPAPMALALPGLYTQPNAVSPCVIGGYNGNSGGSVCQGATIGGGGEIGFTNQVTGGFGTIGGGWGNTAWVDATVGGGGNNTASGFAATVDGGDLNTASGVKSTIGGGENNAASGAFAVVPGGNYAAATHYGELAYAGGGGYGTGVGMAQTSVYVLNNMTTNEAQTELFLDGTGATQRITLANNRTLTFDILIVARASVTGHSASYRIQGGIKNVGGTTSFVGAPVTTVLGEDVAAWDAVAQADNTNDALVVKVTGVASTSIYWVATVHTAEVAW